MPITKVQLEKRRNSIGSSDLPAILGVDPWRNAADVYAEKVYGTQQVENDAMHAGTVLEAAILDHAEQKLGKLKRNQARRVHGTPIRVHIDALLVDAGEPVEGKTSGIVSFHRDDDWGDAGTDEVPERVIVQCQGHILGATKNGDTPKRCHVVALIGGRGFVEFVVPYDAELSHHIVDEAQRFWSEHVVTKEPPPNITPALETLKRMNRRPESQVELTDYVASLCEVLENYKQTRKDADDGVKRVQRDIIAALADAEAGTLPDGRQVTYLEQGRTSIDRDWLKRDWPDLCSKLSKTSTFRVLRVTKGTSE